jgi:hypothetical protein
MAGDVIPWRRLDAPGHDACRLERTSDGWRLDGAAVFRHEDGPACLAYEVACDSTWRTVSGSVRGWIGSRDVDLRIVRTPDGAWLLNGAAVAGLGGCVDLDFGFTPATNLFQVRRVALDVGQGADVPVAWLDVPAAALEELRQRYERRDVRSYRYDAPRFGYRAELEFNDVGFAVKYPPLWEAVA